MPRLYRDDDIENRGGGESKSGTYSDENRAVIASLRGPESVVALPAAAVTSTPSPKVFENDKVQGLLSTFNSLVERAGSAKYARTAEMYKGLAGVVAQMTGFASAERSGDISHALTARGQDITSQGQMATAQTALARLAVEAKGHEETRMYHEGMLSKMAEDLGFKREESGRKSAESTRRLDLVSRGLDIDEAKNVATAENAGLKAMANELVGVNRMGNVALFKQRAKEGSGEMKQPVLSRLPLIGGMFDSTKQPNVNMQTEMKIRSATQSGLEDILTRYGVNGMTGGAGDRPTTGYQPGGYKSLLDEEY